VSAGARDRDPVRDLDHHLDHDHDHDEISTRGEAALIVGGPLGGLDHDPPG
jgi:hypothetical protein